jgi:hypothetical protein
MNGIIWQKKTEILGKKKSLWHFVYHKSHMYWPNTVSRTLYAIIPIPLCVVPTSFDVKRSLAVKSWKVFLNKMAEFTMWLAVDLIPAPTLNF